MIIGISADHAGFNLKKPISIAVQQSGNELRDFGAFGFVAEDDFPDYVIPLCRAVANGAIDRGIAICGSGIGACIVANKINGVRASVVSDCYSAHQGVEDDDMNVLCIGARITGGELALEIVDIFLRSKYSGSERHLRRILQISDLEYK